MSNLPPLPPRPNFSKPNMPSAGNEANESINNTQPPTQPQLPFQPPQSIQPPTFAPPAQPVANAAPAQQPSFPAQMPAQPPVASPNTYTPQPHPSPYGPATDFQQYPVPQGGYAPQQQSFPPAPPKNKKGLMFALIGGGAFLLLLMAIGGAIVVNTLFNNTASNPSIAAPETPENPSTTPIEEPPTDNTAGGYGFSDPTLENGTLFNLSFEVSNDTSTTDPGWTSTGDFSQPGLTQYQATTEDCFLSLYTTYLSDVNLSSGNDYDATNEMLSVALEGTLTPQQVEERHTIETIKVFIEETPIEMKTLKADNADGTLFIGARAFNEAELGFTVIMSCSPETSDADSIWFDTLDRTQLMFMP